MQVATLLKCITEQIKVHAKYRLQLNSWLTQQETQEGIGLQCFHPKSD